MKAHTTTRDATHTTGRRSLFARTAAIAVGALSVASMALVGAGSSASASPADQSASRPAAHVAQQTVRGLEFFCLEVEGFRGGGDRDCGSAVAVGVRRAIRSVEFTARRTAICVAVRGLFGAADAECSRRGGSVEAGVPGVVASVRLWADDTALCGRARSNGRWSRIECSDRRGWLELATRGRGGLDGLQVWVRRGR
jgi:hypothetical protein